MTGDDASQARQRTCLAWLRTSLGVLAGSLGIARLVSVQHSLLAFGVAALGCGCALVVTAEAQQRYAALRTGDLDAVQAPVRLVAATTLAVALIGALALLAILLTD